jgi:FkbM family methyltransferase
VPPTLTRRLSKPVKNWIRHELDRRGLELVADPFGRRLVRMIHSRGIDTVIDGGANVGQFGQLLRSAGFAGRIYSVEPLSAAYAALAATAADDPRWTAERAAFSDAEGTLTINVSGNSVSSSALPMLDAHSSAAPESTYVGTESVRTVTVDAFVDRHGIDPARTLLKLDVQGYERQALEGAAGILPAVGVIETELSLRTLYDGQALIDDVLAYLRDRGFALHALTPVLRDPRTGEYLQFDGLLTRR